MTTHDHSLGSTVDPTGDTRLDHTMTGQCRCGQVHFTITARPIMTAACHCAGCQSMSSSAFSLTAMVPGAAFAVTGGEPVLGGLHGPDLHHFFCPHCMTWMFTRIEGIDAFVNVRPTLLQDSRWTTPFIETMTKNRLSWVRTPAKYQFDEFPPMDQFDDLMKAFAASLD
ncbi:GFA family protein [Thalassospira marina]|nr:GFA family protein [Thalassospira marina]